MVGRFGMAGRFRLGVAACSEHFVALLLVFFESVVEGIHVETVDQPRVSTTSQENL